MYRGRNTYCNRKMELGTGKIGSLKLLVFLTSYLVVVFSLSAIHSFTAPLILLSVIGVVFGTEGIASFCGTDSIVSGDGLNVFEGREGVDISCGNGSVVSDGRITRGGVSL